MTVTTDKRPNPEAPRTDQDSLKEAAWTVFDVATRLDNDNLGGWLQMISLELEKLAELLPLSQSRAHTSYESCVTDSKGNCIRLSHRH